MLYIPNIPIVFFSSDSSSPASVPLTTATKSYPLNTVNENSGKASYWIENTEALEYAIIGLGVVCCVFVI